MCVQVVSVHCVAQSRSGKLHQSWRQPAAGGAALLACPSPQPIQPASSLPPKDSQGWFTGRQVCLTAPGCFSCSAAEQTCQVASESMSCAEGKAAGEGAVRKRTADQESCVPPKRGGGPYGGWTTVEQRCAGTGACVCCGFHVCCRTQEEDEEGTNEGGEGREERGGAVSSDDEDVEVLTFQEKTLAAPGPMAPGSFKGFGFRKKLGGARTHFRTKNTHAFT